jgi:hypothetical protein
MVIDCNELYKGGSDPSFLSSLARQTGYWPVFTSMGQVGGLVDAAAVGLTGQKSMSTSQKLVVRCVLMRVVFSWVQCQHGQASSRHAPSCCIRSSRRRLRAHKTDPV